MNTSLRPLRSRVMRNCASVVCVAMLLPGDTFAIAQSQQPTTPTQKGPAKIPAEQLDSLIAPIALYPDPLLAQVLAASTYPLEIIQLQQWLEKNPNLKDKPLADAVEKQPWDPSVQALAGLADVVKRLANDIAWTTDLGNAFLAQQSDVMEAVQRMRKKAQEKGSLKSTEQQKVETKVIENKSVIIIEQANPQVVYVPSYDPVAVWGYPVYPYPAIYYPPPGYYVAGMAISFGIGIAMGAFWGGGWGWGCGWGGNNVTVNNFNNFNRNANVGGGNRGNIGGGNRGNIGGGNRGDIGGNGGNLSGNRPSNPIADGGNRGGLGGPSATNPIAGGGGRGGIGGPSVTNPIAGNGNWQHNPAHRGGAPYRDRATADRFGGLTRGDSIANRQASARQQLGRQGGNLSSARGGGLGNRGGVGGGSTFANRTGGGGPDRIGSRDLSRSGGGNRDAFGGGARGYNGSSARGSSSRGASSMGSRGGGGFSGGGGRGGGGGRRR
jgi:hypothetical protein